MDQTRTLPELLLPAGSFDSGIAAFEGGADAVYLGFSSFSARAQARNFGREEYRRLLAHARGIGRKIYVALNTLVFDEEMPAAASLASFLAHFPPDAVIVQDWGLVRLLRSGFPGLTIHASTQMAIQTPEAASLAGERGISRVVLPRETGLAGIRDFVSRVPSMEFEVFVHGALCYSYSGLCHASGVLLGRSGNRGQCAQICRSWFDRSEPEGSKGKPGYWFSCKDLDLSGNIAELIASGVHSLKVEGRMKSPEYCHAVARLYRTALDSFPASTNSLVAARNETRLTFARDPSRGYFLDRAGKDLIDADYPGHRGIVVGSVVSSKASSRTDSGRFDLEIQLSGILGLRDGLMVFTGPTPSEPEKFGVGQMTDARTGRILFKAVPGDRIVIPSPCPAAPGNSVFRISARYLDRKTRAPEEFPPALVEIGLGISVRDGIFRARLRIPDCSALPGGAIERMIGSGDALPFQAASGPPGFSKALNVFAESGSAEFRFVPTLDDSLATGPDLPAGGIPASSLFLPPSRLKAVKKALYEECARIVESTRTEHALAAITAATAIPLGVGITAGAVVPGPEDARRLNPWPDSAPGEAFDSCRFGPPSRSSLVFPHKALPSGMPYATIGVLESGLPLPESQGYLWLPLPPLVRDFPRYAALARARIHEESAKGLPVMIGLSAFHYIPFARSLAGNAEENNERNGKGRILFFADTTLNIANAASLCEMREILGSLAFAYPPAETSREYVPPLFHSAGCLLRQSEGHGVCPDGCDRGWTADYSGKSGRFRAVVEDCITMVFLIS